MNKIDRAVERHRELILEAERYIWAHPETGYKEYKTNEYLKEKFTSLGYEIVAPDDITGFYTVIDTGREGPELLILGELDSIICPAHKEADPVTGAVHSCGHNAQTATLLGIAAALTDKSLLEGLSGRIRLCAVPAEELLEIEYRSRLRKEGRIKYFGGKSEFLSRGYFDGVDLAFMVHTGTGGYFAVGEGCVGCIAKKIIYKGQAAHAGGAPWNGKNALYAATLGLNAINAIRETFREDGLIRVHPIITGGGDMVNAIPEVVTLESYVRGSSFSAISEANERVNRALVGAAVSIGTNVEIIDIPGYAPLKNDTGLISIAEEALRAIDPEANLVRGKISTGSTDMGDLSCIMPVIHPSCPGAKGKSHGNDYYLYDPETACIKCAKWQLNMLTLLLSDGAERAKRIVSEYTPEFHSKEEFLRYQDSLNTEGDLIEYSPDGTVNIKLSPERRSDSELVV